MWEYDVKPTNTSLNKRYKSYYNLLIILNLFILNFRPSKTAKAYKEIWMKDKNKSPLRHFTEVQAEKLSQQFR